MLGLLSLWSLGASLETVLLDLNLCCNRPGLMFCVTLLQTLLESGIFFVLAAVELFSLIFLKRILYRLRAERLKTAATGVICRGMFAWAGLGAGLC